ncbi:MAG: adenylate/guanylate cyclase domain-containing protein [Thermoguttaceae bacterium]
MKAGEAGRFRLTYLLRGAVQRVDCSQPEVLIGRGPECDVILNEEGVSRRHALIRRAGDGWTIIDQGSRNGTYVNQRRIVEQPLADGDRISPGPEALTPTVLTFHSLSESAPPESPLLFSDGAGAASVSLSMRVDQDEPTVGLAPPGGGLEGPPAALPRSPMQVIGLFQEVSEVLLAATSLDEILEKVIALALAHLPVERGAICLCDPSRETLVPTVVRARGVTGGESITISRSIAQAAVHARQALLVTDAPADAQFARAPSIREMKIQSAMCAPLYHAGQVQGLIYVDTCEPGSRLAAGDLRLLTALGGLTAVGIEQMRLRDDVDRERAIRARLARYSSPGVVERIIAQASGTDGEMISEQHEASVLFGDLIDFTPLAEGMHPTEVAQILNEVFGLLTEVVFAHGGTLDKYLGDAVMAIFGAPLPQADHAQRAVRAALRMHQLLDELNSARPESRRLRMRIGINSGTVVAGDIGSPIRKDYTVIGDTVNVASRLESSVAEAGQVVIGPATFERCKELFACRPLAQRRLKGKQQTMVPYLVLGPAGAAMPREAPPPVNDSDRA